LATINFALLPYQPTPIFWHTPQPTFIFHDNPN
jgi:hypothetical protein